MTLLPFVKLVKGIVVLLLFALPSIVRKEEIVAIKPINFAVNVQRVDIKVLRIVFGTEHEEIDDLPKKSTQLISFKLFI